MVIYEPIASQELTQCIKWKLVTFILWSPLQKDAFQADFKPTRYPGGFEIISGWKIILGMLLYKVGFPFLRNPTSYSNMSEWSLTQILTINNH